MILKVCQETKSLTEMQENDLLDNLADLLFDMWNIDIKENENQNT
jgi:hypothetical protein